MPPTVGTDAPLGATPHADDLGLLLASRHDNGADHWATADGRIGIEHPVSTLTALRVLCELRVPRTHEALVGAAALVLAATTPDGRIRVAPRGAVYPCHTAGSAAALCRNGLVDDPRVQRALDHLLVTRHDDGGWRCSVFRYGHGPETDASNPGVTLHALDAFRCARPEDELNDLGDAVGTLLHHWTVRVPTGPCHFGIGSLFMQVEYPFLRYNLFYVAHVLSFYPAARRDGRFREMLDALRSKLDAHGQLVVERPHRALAGLQICAKGRPSEAATGRYREILDNLGR